LELEGPAQRRNQLPLLHARWNPSSSHIYATRKSQAILVGKKVDGYRHCFAPGAIMSDQGASFVARDMVAALCFFLMEQAGLDAILNKYINKEKTI
jgi:hypothetical protein